MNFYATKPIKASSECLQAQESSGEFQGLRQIGSILIEAKLLFNPRKNLNGPLKRKDNMKKKPLACLSSVNNLLVDKSEKSFQIQFAFGSKKYKKFRVQILIMAICNKKM